MESFIQRKTAGETKRHVYVTVLGGVAYAAYIPGNVEVHIIDFDDLKEDYNGTLAHYSLEERDFLQQIEAEASTL